MKKRHIKKTDQKNEKPKNINVYNLQDFVVLSPFSETKPPNPNFCGSQLQEATHSGFFDGHRRWAIPRQRSFVPHN